MIDVSKIRVGDEVTVRATVREVADGTKPIRVSRDPWVGVSDIATHTPKPREFKPGDRVTWGNGLLVYEFIAARNSKAVLWSDEYQWQIHDVSHLRHADESE
jgi:hypothetical protein